MRRLISSGSTFEHDIGYSRAVVDGDWVFVSGTTGFDYATMTIADDVVEQAEQCLRNIGQALGEAGCSFAMWCGYATSCPNADDFPACWPALRQVLRPSAARGHDDRRPALSDPRMKIEIEVTARRGGG